MKNFMYERLFADISIPKRQIRLPMLMQNLNDLSWITPFE